MKVHIFDEIETEFIDRVHRLVWCNVATVDTRNRVRSRILHPIWEGGSGWGVTRRQSLKAKHIAHNSYVLLAYIAEVATPNYVDCTAAWSDDLADKRRIWDLFLTAPAPLGYDFGNIFKGADDPECGLLKFRPWRIEMADMINRDSQKIWLSQDLR